MKNIKYHYSIIAILSIVALLLLGGCERDLDKLDLATYPANGEVFIDGFSSSLEYEAWGDVTAFDVDSEVKYMGTSSMKFAVPNEGETGGYAGGAFKTSVPRDLSGFNALTFWAKASKAAEIDVIGFGNNSQGSKYQSTLYGVKVTTNWRKVIIPIANPSLLKAETGLLYYSEAPEEGNGYTFWIDEVQYETLGTIAHPQPMILEGQTQSTLGVIGQTLDIGGNAVSYNMPNGVNQKVYVTPYYFTYTSSDDSVATVNENGQIELKSIGTTTINAMLGDTEAEGSITVEVSDFNTAPIPQVPAEDVISIFSDAYTNVPVDYYNGYWAEGQTTQSEIFTVGADNILSYYDLNWVGIQFSGENEIDATGMTHLHLDLYLPNPLSASDVFEVEVASPNGSNASLSLSATSSPALVSENWISVDLALTSSNIDNLFQIIFANGGSSLSAFYVDNIYFYKDGTINPTDEPTVAAPAPTASPADVISIYSDAYDDLAGTDYPNWGQVTVLSTLDINGDNILKLEGLDYQGIQLANSTDVSGMTYLHLDFWSTTSTSFNIYLISTGPSEAAFALTVPTTGWSSVDIPLTAFAGVDLADVIQLKVDGNGTVFMDNLYFYYDSGGSTGSEPTVAAPIPTASPADVISIYSDAYDDLAGTDYPNWGQVTVLSTLDINGDNVLKLEGLDFQGIQLANSTDVSGMTYLHLDFWSTTSTSFNIYLISTGPAETAFALTVPTTGWSSVDIPLTAFAGVDLADVIQLKVDGNGTVFMDNLYFLYDSGGSTGTEPTHAAPTPTHAQADVISLFSDAYTDVSVDTWKTEWSAAELEDVTIAGNAVKKYSQLDFVGIETATTTIDVTDMTHFHIDVWSPDFTFFAIKLVDFGADGAYDGGDDVEHQIDYATPSQGQWISYDIPLSDFTNLTTIEHMAQYILVGQPTGATTIFVDNVYFHK
jgi:hypothetical protein